MNANQEYTARAQTLPKQLRAAWRDRLTEDERNEWLKEFAKSPEEGGKPQHALRAEFSKKLDLTIKHDSQLGRFRKWLGKQAKMAEQAEKMAKSEAKIRQEHPEWTFDQVRDAVLQEAYFEVLNGGDYKLGLQIVRTHTYVQKYLLDRDKFEFDATERCRRLLPTLRPIQQDSNLSEADKLRLIRLKLFGRIAEEQPQPTCLPPAAK